MMKKLLVMMALVTAGTVVAQAQSAAEKLAANSVVLREVPPNCTVVGVPGRIVRYNGEKLDQIHTPDPIAERLTALEERVAELEEELKKKESAL